MNDQELAESIVKDVGGIQNITALTHCMTRLRFTLVDESKAEKELLEKTDGVLGTAWNGTQYMVVLGDRLIPVYEKARKILSENHNENNSMQKKHFSVSSCFQKTVGFVSASLTPVVPGLIAGGMLKVVLMILCLLFPSFSSGSTYALLFMISDAPFYFLPVIASYGAAVKLGSTPAYAMVSTAVLLIPDYLKLIQNHIEITLFSIPVSQYSYGYLLIPALFISILACYMERWMNKIISGLFRPVLAGMLVILITGTAGYLFLGPVGYWIGEGIGLIFRFLSGKWEPLAAGMLACVMPLIVEKGMHTALSPFMIQALINPGYDAIVRPAFFLHNMAEGGTVLGHACREKDKSVRKKDLSIACSCLISGVTEPAIYGVNKKHNHGLIPVMIGGACGGITAGLLGVRAFTMGYSCLLAFPIFGNTALAMLKASLVAVVSSAVAAYMMQKEEISYKDSDIVSIADGNIIPITEVNDPVFNSKRMGDGIAFQLSDNLIVSPANGKVTVMFPDGHAFGITTKEGVELLVHIGIDTVNLQGDGFHPLVKQGDSIHAGDPAVRIDFDEIKKKGYDTTTMLIITNANGKHIVFRHYGKTKKGTILYE